MLNHEIRIPSLNNQYFMESIRPDFFHGSSDHPSMFYMSTAGRASEFPCREALRMIPVDFLPMFTIRLRFGDLTHERPFDVRLRYTNLQHSATHDAVPEHVLWNFSGHFRWDARMKSGLDCAANREHETRSS